MKPVWPQSFNVYQCFISNHTIDRGSVGSSAMHYGMHIGMLWVVYFGLFHDIFNAVKNSGKNCLKRRVWNTVVKFASIVNLNHGPYRTGAWGKAKQSGLSNYIGARTSKSADFRSVAVQSARHNNQPCETDTDFEIHVRGMARIPSCVEAGPVLKFARRGSIAECWAYLRPELWYLKAVLKDMNSKPDEVQEEAVVERTAHVDTDLAQATAKRKGSLIKTAPDKINQELIDIMDMFVETTSPLQALYSKHATHIKGPEEGLQRSLEVVNGAFQEEFAAIARKAWYDITFLHKLGVFDHDSRAERNIRDLVTFNLTLMTEWAIRRLPAVLQYPQTAVRILDPDNDKREAARREALEHWNTVLWIERQASEGNIIAKDILADITWINQLPIRLFLALVEKKRPCQCQATLPTSPKAFPYVARTRRAPRTSTNLSVIDSVHAGTRPCPLLRSLMRRSIAPCCPSGGLRSLWCPVSNLSCRDGRWCRKDPCADFLFGEIVSFFVSVFALGERPEPGRYLVSLISASHAGYLDVSVVRHKKEVIFASDSYNMQQNTRALRGARLRRKAAQFPAP